MKIELLDGTTENPLQKMGFNAGVCWGAPLDDKEKNIKRAISCIKAGHGRVIEYVDVVAFCLDVIDILKFYCEFQRSGVVV